MTHYSLQKISVPTASCWYDLTCPAGTTYCKFPNKDHLFRAPSSIRAGGSTVSQLRLQDGHRATKPLSCLYLHHEVFLLTLIYLLQGTKITRFGLQVLEARGDLTEYAHQRYETAATQAQRSLVEFTPELRQEDLHVRMPDIVKKSS